MSSIKNLPYDPQALPRELKDNYISASKQDIKEMLKELNLNSIEDLFSHIPKNLHFDSTPEITNKLSYEEILDHMGELSQKNRIKTSFIGDGLNHFKIPEIVNHVSNIRGLSTAYTPYQPERSQGTLNTLWLYSSTLSMLTGFEAINASMYDRSTCLFEALNSAIKITRKSDTVIVFESIYPNDLKVLNTLRKHTKLNIVTVPVDPKTGVTSIDLVYKKADELGSRLGGIAFPQVNSLGNLEDVHSVTDLCSSRKIQSIAIIDPLLIASGGLIPPSMFGKDKQGTNILVGEGQHLALAPNLGGPGLGIFGIRFNEKNKNSIRSTPGRYVGKAKDANDQEALSMVLSTREQHIRREKACSNICSNQSFIATLAGAAILQKGDKGLTESCVKARENAVKAAKELLSFENVTLAFPNTPFYNEFVLELPVDAKTFIENANKDDIHIGVDVSSRIKGSKGNHLLLSFSDIHSLEDTTKLVNFFKKQFTQAAVELEIPTIPANYIRSEKTNIPSFSLTELKEFYDKLGEQNISPDNFIYPLGSCTMKYNPYINDYVASLPGFTNVHPEAPIEDIQGSLEILYETQEMFKTITGLPAVTTEPLAGAQGELVGIKLFQAYHEAKGENEKRDIILIPRSAHGTNPATATMAGYETKTISGVQHGIITIEANDKGQMDLQQLKDVISSNKGRIAGIMVTNPNTSGIFEEEFKKMADLIHQDGGLVYMDGANMNAIAGWIDLSKLGVDAVHNNLHKTWSISHGGGGPGDAIVAVSEKLIPYLPGIQVIKKDGKFRLSTNEKSIGSFHRHFGNFAHKIRAYAYLKALGSEGVRQMSAVAVLCARYLFHKLKDIYPTLPFETEKVPRMHEFIITITKDSFDKIEKAGVPKAIAIAKIGKLFLDYGLHAPTVAFPEIFGLMIEPTESYNKNELDRFVEVLKSMHSLIDKTPEVLQTVPHFTPVRKVDEVSANKKIVLSEEIKKLPKVHPSLVSPKELADLDVESLSLKIIEAHKKS